VLLAHGFNGDKNENGLFSKMAQTLMEAGIASLRMDFAGCGENRESWEKGYRLSYMIDDLASCKEWLSNDKQFDMSRLGIIGLSLGGRTTTVAISNDPQYKTAVLWAPYTFDWSPFPGIGVGRFGLSLIQNTFYFILRILSFPIEIITPMDRDKRFELHAKLSDMLGLEKVLGIDWFNDMRDINFLEKIDQFTGDLFVISGCNDKIVPPEAAEYLTEVAVNAHSRESMRIEGAGHDFGIKTDTPEISNYLIEVTEVFFKKNLCQN
jgi:esterase/lipase